MAFNSVKISAARLKELIDVQFHSVSRAARALDIAAGTIFNWLKQTSPGVDPEIFQRMVEVFGVLPGDLKHVNGHAHESAIAPTSFDALPIPEWDIDLRANTWAPVPCASLDTNDPEQAAVIASGRFRLRLAGHCMTPEYSDGQVIEFQIVRIDMEPLEIGRDFCFCRIDNSATFKRLVQVNDDDYSLAAINQRDFPGVIVVPKQEICRIAKVLYRLQPPPVAKVPKIKSRR